MGLTNGIHFVWGQPKDKVGIWNTIKQKNTLNIRMY